MQGEPRRFFAVGHEFRSVTARFHRVSAPPQVKIPYRKVLRSLCSQRAGLRALHLGVKIVSLLDLDNSSIFISGAALPEAV